MTPRAIVILLEEHRWIARLLECLERVLEDARTRGRVEAASAAEALALCEHFADGLHQEREERGLFPRLLLRARSVEERTAIGRLCGDHEVERRSLRVLGQRLLGAIYGRGPDLAEFLREGEAFVHLQRNHLAHENRTLLPLAEARLEPTDDAHLLEIYATLERGGPGAGEVAARIQRLGQRLGIVERETPAGREL